jgi:RNA polymerase sigma-70 factor (ECF subfamily)
MAYNLCKNEYRQETVHLTYSEECLKRGEETVEPFDKLENDERYSCLRRAIQALPTVQRDAFLLHYDEELTIAEVSRITDTPEGTVKSRVYAALDTIRKEMDKLK